MPKLPSMWTPLIQASRFHLIYMVSSSRTSTMLLTAVSMPNSSATDHSRILKRIFLLGKLPLRKVLKSMRNLSTRTYSTKLRVRHSNWPSLPNLLPQLLSSTRVSGASMLFKAEPTNSLSGQKVATRADWRLVSSTQRATRCMQKLLSMPRLARNGLNIRLSWPPTETMQRLSSNSLLMARVPSFWM